jgi:Ni/Co efflux regulator RcnB
MKRFLSVLIASMFLASAAIAAEKADKMGDEKKAEGEAKGEKTKGEKGEKTKGEKGEKTKGEKGEKTKGEKATDEKTK